jgi:hypothetical protein
MFHCRIHCWRMALMWLLEQMYFFKLSCHRHLQSV